MAAPKKGIVWHAIPTSQNGGNATDQHRIQTRPGQANASGGALKFIGFEVRSSPTQAGKLKAKRSKIVGENCVGTRTQNSVGTLHLKATNEWQSQVHLCTMRGARVCAEREIMSPLTATATVGNEDVNDKLKLLKTSHWQGVGRATKKGGWGAAEKRKCQGCGCRFIVKLNCSLKQRDVKSTLK